jgi:hypothetical protein
MVLSNICLKQILELDRLNYIIFLNTLQTIKLDCMNGIRDFLYHMIGAKTLV